MSGCSSSLVAASKGSLLEEARRTWFSYQRQVMSKIFSTVLIITCGPLHVCLSHLCSHTCASHLLQLSRIHSMGLIGLLEWTIQFSISLGMMLLHFVNGVEKDCLQKLNGSMPAGLAYRTSMWTWLLVLVIKFLWQVLQWHITGLFFNHWIHVELESGLLVFVLARRSGETASQQGWEPQPFTP